MPRERVRPSAPRRVARFPHLASLGVAGIALVVVLLAPGGERSVHEVRITLGGTADPGARAVGAPGFDIDVSTHERGAPGEALPDWIEPTTRRGGPGPAEQVIVTMGRDASAAITADHVVLVRGDESVVLDIGGDEAVEPPPDAPGWIGRDDPLAPVVARFGRAGSIEVAARGIRVQRRGPG